MWGKCNLISIFCGFIEMTVVKQVRAVVVLENNGGEKNLLLYRTSPRYRKFCVNEFFKSFSITFQFKVLYILICI